MDELIALYNDKKIISSFKNYHLKEYPPIYVVNTLPIHFDPKFKKIGITMSGGADSTMLFYILCKLIEDTGSECKIYPITMIRNYKDKPWDEIVQDNVYNWFYKKFPNIVQNHIKGFIPSDLELVPISTLGLEKLNKQYGELASITNVDVICITNFTDYLLEKNNLDYMYSGTTTNPTDIDNAGAPIFRNQENMQFDVNKVISKTNIDPFALITKDWIIAQYYNFNILDLLDLTRSCDKNIEVSNTDTIPQPCNECFFCKERNWAIDNKDKYLMEIQDEPSMLLRSRRHKFQEWIRNFLPATK